MKITDRLTGNGGWYIRVSGDEQDTESQRQSVQRWLAENRLAVAPQFRFEDDGFERDRPELRPEFQRMLKCAEAGLLPWVVADRQDRFGTKNKHQFIHFMYLLREAGCEFVTTDGKVWTDDNMMTFFEGGMGAETSEKEQKEKSHRTLRGKISKAKKGEYQGGHVPFGMDVACYGVDGHEKWRVIIDGRKLVGTKPGKGGRQRRVYSLRRLKIMPNGSVEVFEGHRTFPAVEKTDKLRLAPSKDQRLLDVVVDVFTKYAEEATCPTVLAAYLNTLNIKHPYADRWEHYHVREMLKNPIYIGRQRWNSHGQGRFHEYLGGTQKPVKETRGGRIRSKADWVLSDQLFEPVVPKKVWEAVQAKLEKNPPQRRSPRSPDLWLRGLLYCSHCGQLMRGVNRPTRHEYVCSTYAKDKRNATCLRHCVNHNDIEDHIKRYLAEAGREAAVMLDVQKTGNIALLKPFEEKHKAVFQESLGPLVKIMATLARDKGEGGEFFKQWVAANNMLDDEAPASKQNMQQVADEFMTLFQPLQKMYDAVFSGNAEGVQQQLAAVEAQHTKLTENVLNLDPVKAKRAIQKANDKIGQMEEEMQRLEGELVNYSDHFDQRNEELRAVSVAFDNAEAALDDPAADSRRKANAVRACIQRINPTFKPTGKKYPKSELAKVEIIPVDQHGPEHPNGASC